MEREDIALREVFHFLFLERLLKASDVRLFVLKGGVNLRFFFRSPRYSEDMDLDVLGGALTTLKKNAYKILGDASFRRALAAHGVADLIINDPSKAKQTETTQRFRVRLVTKLGEEFPTKVEFSRREAHDQFMAEEIDPAISATYQRLSYRCQHYPGGVAVAQKIRALANRPITQARDILDLYILYLGNHLGDPSTWNVSGVAMAEARENALAVTYEHYRDQVVNYLSKESEVSYAGRAQWEVIRSRILDILK